MTEPATELDGVKVYGVVHCLDWGGFRIRDDIMELYKKRCAEKGREVGADIKRDDQDLVWAVENAEYSGENPYELGVEYIDARYGFTIWEYHGSEKVHRDTKPRGCKCRCTCLD